MSAEIILISVCYTVEIDSEVTKLACFDTIFICIYQLQETLALLKA